MRPALDLLLVVALLALAVHLARTDPRRWRIGVLLVGALWAALSAVGVDVLLLPRVLSVVLGLLFVGNGLRLLRPQGRGLTNVLALLLGLAILTTTAVGIGVAGSSTTGAIDAVPTGPEVVGIVVLLLPGYPALAFGSFVLYCLTYRRHRARAEPAAVVVLGSGLVGGTVPQLLAHRLDAAAEAWRAERDRGHECLLVPSGGQGDDEPMSEGVAMTAYLMAHGIPQASVATEDRATTTEENLLLSREILRSRGIGDAGPLRVVTSNYHVGRAALLTRRLGIDADVTGGPTAWYFVPSAFMREFLAALTLHPRTNLAGLGLWAAWTAWLAYAVLPV
ncbi:YdcF family protein [Terrabacter sp. Ter38]|uniref:YdcF family protein n=1 Tax=Terrabacter sp. Ter38 TaxID=2926030 RepID=UPI002118721A|nr:YdcF family protein [Terrabacter sp. Ter38]